MLKEKREIAAKTIVVELMHNKRVSEKYQGEGHKFARLCPVRSMRGYAVPLKPVSSGKLP